MTIMRGWMPVLIAVVGSSMDCRQPPNGSLPLDALARSDSQLQARREAFQRMMDTNRRASKPIQLQSPTVVAFYPGLADTTGFLVDTLAFPAVAPFRRHLEAYRAASAKTGYQFEIRDSRGVHVVDPTAYALTVGSPIAADSVGLVVAIPGQPLRVWYGLQLEAALAARLRELLPGHRVAQPVGTS